jgi:predicted MPP superfamily phosphohydrolase
VKLWALIAVTAFLFIYGGLHLYVFKKLTIVLPYGHWLFIPLFGFLVISTLLVTISADPRFLTVQKLLGWICYTWMGLIFLFFSFSLALDLIHVIASMIGRLLHTNSSIFTLNSYYRVIVAGVLSLVVTAHGLFAARQINVERIIIPTSKLGESHNPFRIVQISDMHLGLLSEKDHFQRLVEIIRSLEPDIVVSTGDLVDVQLDHLGDYADLLSELKPTHGKYSVTGNHEAFAGVDRAMGFMERAGFTTLSYDGVKVNEVINIVGVDDPAVSNRLRIDTPPEREILRRFPEEGFTILLKHQPIVDGGSRDRFDLQLSGHTHGGQIFPFILLTKLFYSSRIGLSRLDDNTFLYVSRGTGSWGPPIRFLAPPEVTVIELQSDQGGLQNE